MGTSRLGISGTGDLTTLLPGKSFSKSSCSPSPSRCRSLPSGYLIPIASLNSAKQEYQKLIFLLHAELGLVRALNCACLIARPPSPSPPPPSSLSPLPSFLFLFLSLHLPGFGSYMECCVSSTGIPCLHRFLCMTLYAVSMLRKKKSKDKKEEKHSAKSNDTFWTKNIITFKVIFSVSNLELRCCLSVLLVSVWLCFASMRPCPLWRFLGEEEPCVGGGGWRQLCPLSFLGGLIGAEVEGMFNPELSGISLSPTQ